MDVQAYGFSYAPPPTITTLDLLAEIQRSHKEKKKWNGQFRIISFLNQVDAFGLFRGGILSVKDEKVALRLIEIKGEQTLAPSEHNEDHVDFNCFLLKIDPKAGGLVMRGIFTSYFGSISVSAWGHLLNNFARQAVKSKIEVALANAGQPFGARAISRYIEDNAIATEGEFKQIIVKSNFEQLVRSLSEVSKIYINYEVVSLKNDEDKPISDISSCIRNSKTVTVTAGTPGSKIARRVSDYIQTMGATSAKAIGKSADGSPDEVDFFANPERFWRGDLDELKKLMTISVENFAGSPIFTLLSKNFHADTRIS